MKERNRIGWEMQWRCLACGYIYVSEKGDLGAGIKPGTAFEDLPDGWFVQSVGYLKTCLRR